MKSIRFPLLLLLFASSCAFGQSFSSAVEVITVYSQNDLFYLKSWPFDNESPSLRGETKVYRKGVAEPIYSFSRGFDSVENESNNLVISNDGEVIFYLVSWGADENTDGLKSISIYKQGRLVQSYTASEITGCDLKKERCQLEISNWEEVVDEEKSNLGSPAYKKVFKAGVSEEEKFLSDFSVFSFNESVYLTDSNRKVHEFGLKEAKHVRSIEFSEAFARLRSKGRFTKVVLERYDAPTFLDFPKLRTGANTDASLGSAMKMKPVKSYGSDSDKFKSYRFKVSGYLLRDGSFEIEKLENFDQLPEAAIRQFFSTQKFDTSSIPVPFAKWWIDEYFFFRKANDRMAMQERKLQLKEQEIARQKRLVAEEIEGRYIPKNLGEAFIELDKTLAEVDRTEMSALPKRDDMIRYHHGLGTWMRNNWGLWGGSRMQKYFTDKGMGHPDDMSSIVLFYYWDWLKGDKEKWKEWERDPKQKLF